MLMSSITGEAPEPPDGHLPNVAGIAEQLGEVDFVEAVRLHDDSHAEMLDSVARFYRFPIERNQTKVRESVNDVTEGLRSLLTRVVESDGTEHEKAATMLTLIMGNEDKRYAFLSELVPDHKFQPGLKEDAYKASIDVVAENLERVPGAVVPSLLEQYKDNLGIDLDDLVESSQLSRSTKMIGIAKTAGKHALDVAKITGAVAAGIWLSNRGKK